MRDVLLILSRSRNVTSHRVHVAFSS